VTACDVNAAALSLYIYKELVLAHMHEISISFPHFRFSFLHFCFSFLSSSFLLLSSALCFWSRKIRGSDFRLRTAGNNLLRSIYSRRMLIANQGIRSLETSSAMANIKFAVNTQAAVRQPGLPTSPWTVICLQLKTTNRSLLSECLQRLAPLSC